MSAGGHTPGPWGVGRTRFGAWAITGGAFKAESPLATIQDWDDAAEADARRIVLCVNAHDALVEALKACAEVMSGNAMTKDALIVALAAARAALAAATGETK